MKVFTYYENLGRDDKPLIDLWRESWIKHGWEPVVLGRKDVEATPWDLVSDIAALHHLPTVNDPSYELHCFLRHTAMSSDGGLLTDYDVINYGFTPDMIDRPTLHSLATNSCPCAIYGTPRDYDWLHDTFVRWNPDVCEKIVRKAEPADVIRPHISDQFICRYLGIQSTGQCVEYGTDGWREAKLVHFRSDCAGVSDGKQKVELITKERPI